MADAPQRDAAIGPEPGVGAASATGVVLTPRQGLTVVRLCAPLDAGPFTAALANAGLALPTVACTSGPWDAGLAFWVGPGEWWLVGADRALAEAAVRAHLPVPPRALVDLSHGRTVVRVAGGHAGDVIAKGCPLDLDPAAFPAGGCPQSVVAGVNLLLHRLPADDGFDLYIPRSYARHVWESLLLAGAEYGVGVTAAAVSTPE